MEENQAPNLTLGRNLKIGLFHLGSGMADVLGSGVWNRIMISDLGYSATPVGLLLSLRYFLAPLGIWAGRISDRQALLGYRRLFWIWLGRAMMALSLLTLGLTTAELARGHQADLPLWAAIAVSLLLFSLGNAFSGSTFLALIYDRSAPSQRGRAVGIVWTFLLLGFSVAGFFFGVLLPSTEGAEDSAQLGFTPETLQTLFIVAALVLAGLWFFSLLGEERRASGVHESEAATEHSASFRADLKLVWSNRQMRLFFWFLGLSMIFAFGQDAVLEPFGGQVFGMDAKHTTRFAAYWGSMSIVGTLAFLWARRRYAWLTSSATSALGVGVLAVTFGVFGLSALAQIRGLVTPGLILLGIGLGIWNVGTLAMMMEFSPAGRAGTFLGFWTMVVTLARGLGVSGGGIIRDVVLSLSGDLALSYAAVFILELLGLAFAFWILRQINVQSFLADYGEQRPAADTATVLAGVME